MPAVKINYTRLALFLTFNSWANVKFHHILLSILVLVKVPALCFCSWFHIFHFYFSYYLFSLRLCSWIFNRFLEVFIVCCLYFFHTHRDRDIHVYVVPLPKGKSTFSFSTPTQILFWSYWCAKLTFLTSYLMASLTRLRQGRWCSEGGFWSTSPFRMASTSSVSRHRSSTPTTKSLHCMDSFR